MGGRPQLTVKEVIRRARAVHGTRYIYRDIGYTFWPKPITIRCRKHGEFSQTAANHCSGKGCPKCGILDRDDVRQYAKTDFSGVGLTVKAKLPKPCLGNTVITVSCSTCSKTYDVKAKTAALGCHKCKTKKTHAKKNANNREPLALSFKKTVRKLHGDLYDTSQVKYVNAKTAVKLICKHHGEFKASPNRVTAGFSTGRQFGLPCAGCRKTGRVKQVKVRGKRFEVRGYEGLAIKHLCAERGYKPSQIATGRDVPKIPLSFKRHDGTRRKEHLPDLFIQKDNLIVEVKSTGTFGFTTFHTHSGELLRLIRHKSRRAKKLGYRYEVMLFGGGKLIKLPKNWDTLSVKQLRDWYAQREA